MYTTSCRNAVRWLPCLQIASHATASSISEWDQSRVDWDQGCTEGVAWSPNPIAARDSGHKLLSDLLHYHGGLLNCLKEVDVSFAVYDPDCTAGMTVRTSRTEWHSRIPWLPYAKWSWRSWVMDSVETCVFIVNHEDAIHLIVTLDPVRTLEPRIFQYYPETKEQYKCWKSLQSPRKKKRTSKCKIKAMIFSI